MKRMKQKDWVASMFCCPVCRSNNVHGTGDFTVTEYECVCLDCGQTFEEIMKLVGYKLVSKSDQSEAAKTLLEEHEENKTREWKYDSKGNVVLGGSRIKLIEV